MPSYIYISYNYLKSNLEYAILQHCYNIKNQTRKKKDIIIRKKINGKQETRESNGTKKRAMK